MIDERALIADILAKFEKYVFACMCVYIYTYIAVMTIFFVCYCRYQQSGKPVQYKLFYKIFCFTNIDNLLIESIEAAFLFEQVTNDLL